MKVSRRHMLRLADATALARSTVGVSLPPTVMSKGHIERSTLRVVAIRFEPKPGDIEINWGQTPTKPEAFSK